jgi:AraC-like DNA-binding protein
VTSATIKVQRVVDLIHKSYTEKLTLKSLATTLRADPGKLGRVFHSIVGVTVHEWVTGVRLEQAAHLIRTGLKIEAVAHGVGYRSKKNFYRQFVRHYGITPETYRRRRGVRTRRTGRDNGKLNGATALVTYAVTFDDRPCLIDVEARPNVNGRPSYFATPFVVLDHGIQPFANTTDHVEVVGESETDALERAAIFLEHRFGGRSAAPYRQHGNKHLPILIPRP